MQTRGRLSQREKTKIAKLIGQGKTITEVAKTMQRNRSTVTRYKKRMHLATPGLPEDKILSMRRRGFTQRQIARRLKLSYRRTFRFFRQHGFARPHYQRFQPSTKQLIEIIDLAMTGNDSAASIARKLGLSYGPLLKLVHRIRRCSTFLPTPTLSSYLPMKHRDQIVPRACEEESMMMLLDCARRACFDCHVAPDPRRLVAVAIAVCAQLYLREKPEARIGDREQQKIVDALTPRFLSACDTLLSAEQAVVH
jgi:DNA-binding CsgD family transcriptional regulator